MRVAFLIERSNFYRLFGPIVDRALERGWETECWHNCGQPRRGPKGSLFPGPDALPGFQHGRPAVREYRSARGLAALLGATPPDAVLALRQPTDAERSSPARWFGLQYTLDVAHLLDVTGATRLDVIGLHTAHWRASVGDALRLAADSRAGTVGDPPAAVDEAAVASTLRARGTLVGFPEMDQWHTIDRAAVRKRLGLADDTPVVLYLPFPFRSNPRTFWVRHVFGRSSRVWRRAAVALARRREYAAHVRAGWTDRAVVDAVRAFCDRNGAALIVKARAKDPVPGYLRRRAAHVFGDERYYPATILELLSVSSLCFHFFSTAAYEAAYAHVPSICIAPDEADLGFPPTWRVFLNVRPGGSFNFPGVVYPMGLDEVLRRLPQRRLADYPLDLVARARYVEKFVGFDDGKASDRVLDAIEFLMGEGRR
jgi:hypothetical protein